MFRVIGKSKIAFVLAILFGLSLFFFRGGSKYSNIFNSDNIIASVSGTPISTTKFNRALQININQFNQMLSKSISSEEIKAFQIHFRKELIKGFLDQECFMIAQNLTKKL